MDVAFPDEVPGPRSMQPRFTLRRLTQLMFLSPRIIERAIKGMLPIEASAIWVARANFSSDFDEPMARVQSLT